MRKWDKPEIAMLDLGETKSGDIWSPVEVHAEYHGFILDFSVDAGPCTGNQGGQPITGGGSECGGKDSGNTPNTADTNRFS